MSIGSSRSGTQGNRSGSAILDGAPPSPTDKIFPKRSRPGEDTASLLGDDGNSDENAGGSNPQLQSAGGRLLQGISLMMQGANMVESVSPGMLSEPVKQAIAQLMEQGPQQADNMARQQNPTSMLSSIGGSAASSPSPAMGSAAMGGGNGGSSAQPGY